MTLRRTICLFGLATIAGCNLTGEPPKTLTIHGVVTDTLTGAPLKATMEVAFGLCEVVCSYQGNPGFAPTDSVTGAYTLQINGPSDAKACGSYQYFVFANGGSTYSLGQASVPCGVLEDTINFGLQPVQPYAVTGTVTLAPNGNPAQSYVIAVGIYPTGTTCLTTGACQSTAIATAETNNTGGYTLSFRGPYLAASCTGKDFLITVYPQSIYAGAEAHVPCGQFTTSLNFQLKPPA
jgi:hypothetical protein